MLTIYAQNILGNLECSLILLIRSFMILFIRSATPFYCGVPRIIFSILIQLVTQYSLNPLSIYSPPLLDFKHFSFKPVLVLTLAFQILKVLKTSDYFFSKNKFIPFYCNHQWMWYSTEKLQEMLLKKDPTNQCLSIQA